VITSCAATDGRHSCAHAGDADGEDWYIDHVKEELDAPREFYFEAATQQLWYVHNASMGTPPPTNWTWEVPMLPVLINISGSKSAPVINVSVSGIKFTGAAASFMMPHGIPSGGDWGLVRHLSCLKLLSMMRRQPTE
jgi:hypothetical protein